MTLHVNSVSNDSLIQQSLSPSSVKNQSYPKVTLQNDSVSFAGAEKANKKSVVKKIIAGLVTTAALVAGGLLIVKKSKFNNGKLVMQTENIGDPLSWICRKVFNPTVREKEINRLVSSNKANEFISSAEKQKAKIIRDEIMLLGDTASPRRIVTKKLPSGTTITNSYVFRGEECPGVLWTQHVKTDKAEILVRPANKNRMGYSHKTEALVLNNDGNAKIIGEDIAIKYHDHLVKSGKGKIEKRANGEHILNVSNMKKSEIGYPFDRSDFY